MEIERRAIGPNDVLLDLFYCGICHSDIHTVRDELCATLPTVFIFTTRSWAPGLILTFSSRGGTEVRCKLKSCVSCC
jgi:alcohol dehydrogenase (NADP+)